MRGGFRRRFSIVQFLRAIGRLATKKPPIRQILGLFKVSVWTRRRRSQLPLRPIIRTKVFGRATKKPPIRALRVLDVAIARAQLIRRKTASRFLRAYGHITRNPPIRAVLARLVAIARAQRIRIKTKSQFLRRFGYATGRAPVRRVRALLVAVARSQRVRIHASALLLKRFGRATSRPPIRAIRALFFSAEQRALRVRIRGRAYFTKVRRSFGVVVVVFPKKIRALFVRRRTPRISSRFTRVFGHVTRRPAIRPIRTAFFASQARMQRKRVHGFAMLLKRIRLTAAIPNLNRLFIDIATGRLGLIVEGTPTGGPRRVIFF